MQFKIESEKPANNSKVEVLLDYFVDSWLDEITQRFSRHMWNHWNNTDRRTITDLEGWRYALNKAAGSTHLNIFEFIVTL